ncbi:hypothetical protein, partial [uncultured Muribaculum sp.]|uniref:hypothetical protein n=1 Tax=uncultured Muribaculum sp. TaxID=1918613 RepID=UPI00272E9C9B
FLVDKFSSAWALSIQRFFVTLHYIAICADKDHPNVINTLPYIRDSFIVAKGLVACQPMKEFLAYWLYA